MTYCTRADLEARYGAGDIADLEFDRAGAVDAAIAGAASLIDSYVGGRFPLPLASVPAVLTNQAVALVRYELDNDPSDAVTARKNDAIKYLDALSTGKATLGVPQAAEPESLDTAEMQNDGHVFSRQNTKDFI